MKFDLRASAQKRLLLVAHRGVWGGNIPCNTIPAYETALAEGADMIEIDVDCTADGQLVIFHPGMEKVFLGIDRKIGDMTFAEIKNLRYRNLDACPTQFGIETLYDVLDRFKGRCYINVDKFWRNPAEISAAIRKKGMTEQVLVKTAPRKEFLDIVEEFCADMPYMAILRNIQEKEALTGRKINFLGTEVLFKEDSDPLASEAYIAAEHADGRLVWCNSIVYDYKAVIAGIHTDDRAILGDPDGSWGWIADRGFDLMQTDRVLHAALYLEKTGRRPRGVLC